MRFTYLGTAAAEGWPAVFCNCAHCHRAKAAGGRNIRTRSQAIINDDLLIDFNSDTYAHALKEGIDLSAVKHLLVTHSHLDHFEPTDLFFRSGAYYAHDLTEKNLTIVANQSVLDRYAKITAIYHDEPRDGNISTQFIPLYTPTRLGRYTVTALRANHAQDEIAYVYHINDGEKSMLYLNDTGRLADEVYDYFAKSGIKADFVSYDCTFGLLPGSGGHLGLDTCIEERARLEASGVCNAGCIHIVTHFSHNGKAIYDEMVPIAAEAGFGTSFDGMIIEI